MNQNQTEKLHVAIVALVFLAILLIATPGWATGGRDDDGQRQEQEQHQKQHQDQSQTSEAHAASESASAANNEGNSLSVNQDYESGPADLVLVPNNNTEGCLRVFGFSFGNRDGSGMFGIPFRSARCDYEQAADDAFAAGERELGWYWKCHNKSLYKTFRSKDESKESAITDCHARMVGEVTNARVIEGLKSDIVFLQNERKIEREKCTESKNRIAESCYQK